MKMKIRPPAVAGMFYPADKKRLARMIVRFLQKAQMSTDGLRKSTDKKCGGEVQAIIVPHAGLVYSGKVAAFGFATLMSTDKEQTSTDKGWKSTGKKNFILLGPAHRVGFEGVAQDTHEWWETPLGKVQGLSFKVQGKGKDLIVDDRRPHLQEHSLEVQLPFLQVLAKNTPEVKSADTSEVEKKKKGFDFTITPLLTGFGVDYKKLAEFLDKRYGIGDMRYKEESVLIVSSDLSHYHSQDAAERIDKKTIKAILDLDIKTLEKEECEACGKTGILTVVELAKKLGWKPKLLHYETSGDVTGDFSQVVGYASIGFFKITLVV